MKTRQDVLDAMSRHACETYPEECCGVLLGTLDAGDVAVEATRAVENRRPEQRERRYLITPEDYRTADRAAQASGLDIVGFYHSHPDVPPVPSQTDLEEATFPGFSYIIVSVRNGRPAETRAWNLVPDRSRFVEDEIVLSE